MGGAMRHDSEAVIVLVSLILLPTLLVSCASMRDTAAQQLAAERWKQCESPSRATIRLREIRPDGQIWFSHYSEAEAAELNECLRNAAREQAARRVSSVTPAAVAEVRATMSSAESWDVPVWRRGDEWAFRWESPRGQGTFVYSVEKTETVDGTDYYVIKSGTRRIYYRTTDLALFMDVVGDEIALRWAPPSTRFPWPLAPGRMIEQTFTEERPTDRQTQEIQLVCEVQRGDETTVVPAGEFRTAKIACRNQRTQQVVHEYWYAPHVKYWVRDRTVFSYGPRDRELLKYRVE
jgi:hypothetical protein